MIEGLEGLDGLMELLAGVRQTPPVNVRVSDGCRVEANMFSSLAGAHPIKMRKEREPGSNPHVLVAFSHPIHPNVGPEKDEDHPLYDTRPFIHLFVQTFDPGDRANDGLVYGPEEGDKEMDDKVYRVYLDDLSIELDTHWGAAHDKIEAERAAERQKAIEELEKSQAN